MPLLFQYIFLIVFALGQFVVFSSLFFVSLVTILTPNKRFVVLALIHPEAILSCDCSLCISNNKKDKALEFHNSLAIGEDGDLFMSYLGP